MKNTGQSEKKSITECLTQRTTVKHKQRSNGESNNNNNKMLEFITRTIRCTIEKAHIRDNGAQCKAK